ncbi:MAG: hydrogenase maturation nickel metallochaperone HypA [Gammaproteobacteria bacterium]|nr:hydrogenase maturation nickel metallochaperone HypA [Gammaproteobacteria bacterium]
MHEFSIIQNIFPIIEKNAKDHHLKIITKVTLNLGKSCQCLPDFLQFAFQTLAKNTIAENAELVIQEIPGKSAVLDCIEGSN